MNTSNSPKLKEAEEASFAHGISELIGMSVMNLVEKMRPPQESTERVKAALFLNICESFQAAIILVRRDLSAHSGLHIRAMLESFVHLTMLNRDSVYLAQMTFDQVKGQLKVQEALAEDPFISAGSKQRIAEYTKELKVRYDELYKQGYRAKKLGDLIKLHEDANLSHYYASYQQLNSMAHWDLTMLTDRHMEKDGGMTIFSKSSDRVTIAVLFTAMMVMVSATAAVEKVTSFAEGVYEKEFDSMNQAWGRYLEHTGPRQE
ncbi:hypothetical protein G5B88_20720 [Herbaspirillum seropedicae]|uniref:Uncharacterized protein n=1 Tax=Herbaspirillum seropedicae (strain SmR1) TaxID=757424 RepID=D8ITD0_HERSS|nr:DUF5677 domain-containing protein [Herbaspirillum seropedicae]ADJ65560.1 hypothetical protein Hsero_4090 [Herbaspirillum seropedicae SmR1]AKN67384.1 hypothetical protein ACP92_20420 [Herbaspirillum seropedicae]NQE31977.1 hypothetical protein [Herbaspirillum seropedicae]UMU23393.1 hypothetical protein G5B88_20720 [Herbaspirillum seropedicae]